jgi:hypothetical protein
MPVDRSIRDPQTNRLAGSRPLPVDAPSSISMPTSPILSPDLLTPTEGGGQNIQEVFNNFQNITGTQTHEEQASDMTSEGGLTPAPVVAEPVSTLAKQQIILDAVITESRPTITPLNHRILLGSQGMEDGLINVYFRVDGRIAYSMPVKDENGVIILNEQGKRDYKLRNFTEEEYTTEWIEKAILAAKLVWEAKEGTRTMPARVFLGAKYKDGSNTNRVHSSYVEYVEVLEENGDIVRYSLNPEGEELPVVGLLLEDGTSFDQSVLQEKLEAEKDRYNHDPFGLRGTSRVANGDDSYTSRDPLSMAAYGSTRPVSKGSPSRYSEIPL